MPHPDQILKAGCRMLGKDGLDVVIPFALSPSPFPRKHFEHALRLQPKFNELVAVLVKEENYLNAIVSKAAQADPQFTGRLYKIWKKTRNTGNRTVFNILRSDYMIDAPTDTLLQVELNTISCACGGLSDTFSKLFDVAGVPANGFLQETAAVFKLVHSDWINENKEPTACILFLITGDEERNVYDQLSLIETIGEIDCFRVKLDSTDVTFEANHMYYKDRPVSICYFRTGYDPSNYYNEQCWIHRESIERSSAVKSPLISTQLAGLKLVQQDLADLGFIQSIDSTELAAVFTEMHCLSDYEKCRTLLCESDSYVLKPQREGGGHNIYGSDILPFIQGLGRDEREGYILMRLIRTISFGPKEVYINGRIGTFDDAVGELGTFGVYYELNGQVVANKECGWVLRTKNRGTREGGLVAGHAVYDAPSLY